MSAQRRRLSDERGMTLAEVVVALFVVTVLFFSFARAMVGALHSSRDTLMSEEATSIAFDRLEAARSVGWDGFALASVDDAAPLLTASGDALDGSLVGLATDESLVVSGSGVLVPRETVVDQDTTFTVWSYVSEFGELRRLVIEVTWGLEDSTRHFRTSTLVSEFTWG